MSTEILKILEMVREGKVSTAEGLDLLNAVEAAEDRLSSHGRARVLRVRVSGDKAKKVNVNIPIKLLKVFSKFASFGMKFIPQETRQDLESKGIDLTELDLNELIQAIDQGLVDEKIIDVDVEDSAEGNVKVEIFVE